MDMSGYLRRLKDLDNPLPLDSPIFLPPRADNSPPAKDETTKKAPVKLPKPLTEEEKEAKNKAYHENIKLPPTKAWDNFTDDVTEVVPGKAWVVLNLLSEEECEEIIRQGEDWGLEADSKVRARTSLRTNNWINEELSIRVAKRLSEKLLGMVEASPPYTSVRCIHPNWRVAKYSQGQTFPAHIDQADSVVAQHPEKIKQRFTSSHTLLIYLRNWGKQFEGGATRLFLDGDYAGTTADICLPQGGALIFQQRGMLHAGMPVEGEQPKYIAQAGLLRGEPKHVSGPSAVFKYGPGLEKY